MERVVAAVMFQTFIRNELRSNLVFETCALRVFITWRSFIANTELFPHT